MMTLSCRAVATAFACPVPDGLRFRADAGAATPARQTKAPTIHSAASLECSKEADAKGLHGKARGSFRSECKKTAADKPKIVVRLACPSPRKGRDDLFGRLQDNVDDWLRSAVLTIPAGASAAIDSEISTLSRRATGRKAHCTSSQRITLTVSRR